MVDTGFWFALFTPEDNYHKIAVELADVIESNNVLIPWPTLYETINTKFCKNKDRITGFDSFVKNYPVQLLNDLDYRETALLEVFENRRNFSLVDRVIRQILSDNSIKIDYLIMFNEADFIDLCSYRRIEILNS